MSRAGIIAAAKLHRRHALLRWLGSVAGPVRALSSSSSGSSTGDGWLQQLTNLEATGVPPNAGTAGRHGFDLGRMHGLLRALGSPQASFPAVHVAGTKGKGSTVAMLVAMLRAAGYRVGSYTSPHVRHLRERVQVDGQPIPAGDWDALLAAGRPVVERQLQRRD